MPSEIRPHDFPSKLLAEIRGNAFGGRRHSCLRFCGVRFPESAFSPRDGRIFPSPDGARLPSVGLQPYVNGQNTNAPCRDAIAGENAHALRRRRGRLRPQTFPQRIRMKCGTKITPCGGTPLGAAAQKEPAPERRNFPRGNGDPRDVGRFGRLRLSGASDVRSVPQAPVGRMGLRLFRPDGAFS